MAQTALSNARPVELGTQNFERISRLLWATGNALSAYRNCANSPSMQPRKAASWSEYQACIAELMEALNAKA